MPKCSRCGSYYIRPPCPVCSPPGETQLVEDSKETRGKTVEELQSELEKLRGKVKERELKLDNRIQDLNTQLNVGNDRVESMELSKTSIIEKKNSLEAELTVIPEVLKVLEGEIEQLEREKNSISNDIRKAEERLRSSDAEITDLKEKIEEEQRKREEEAVTIFPTQPDSENNEEGQ